MNDKTKKVLIIILIVTVVLLIFVGLGVLIYLTTRQKKSSSSSESQINPKVYYEDDDIIIPTGGSSSSSPSTNILGEGKISSLESGENYYIISEDGLYELASLVSEGNEGEGCTIYLLNTLYISSLPSIGTHEHPFKGTFNGKNMSIYLNKSPTSGTSLFSYVENGIIQNVILRSKISSVSTNYNSCGMINYINGGTISNCINEVDMVCGIVGDIIGGDTYITNCINYGKSNGSVLVGGIVYGIYGGNVYITSCGNNGELKGKIFAGGIVGYHKAGMLSIYASYNTSSISSEYAGGIIGYSNDYFTLTSSFNAGTITGNTSSGGLIGVSVTSTSEEGFNTSPVDVSNLLSSTSTYSSNDNLSNVMSKTTHDISPVDAHITNQTTHGTSFMDTSNISISDFKSLLTKRISDLKRSGLLMTTETNKTSHVSNTFDSLTATETNEINHNANALTTTETNEINHNDNVPNLLLTATETNKINYDDDASILTDTNQINHNDNVPNLLLTTTNQTSLLSSCYNIGNVSNGTSTTSITGGIIGYITFPSTIEYTYSIGDVTSGDALIGYAENITTENIFYSLSGKYKTHTYGSSYDSSTSDLGEDFMQDVYEINDGYPILKNVDYYPIYIYTDDNEQILPESYESDTDIRYVSVLESGKTYYVYDSEGFNHIATLINDENNVTEVGICLTCNIELSSFTPIGTKSNPFKGTFYGNHFEIHLINSVSDFDTSYIGLFGYAQNAIITNFKIYGSSILLQDSVFAVGGICGYAYDSVNISKCVNDVIVNNNGSYTMTGGIVGNLHSSTIKKCINSADIYGVSNVGGIAGYASDSDIDNCINCGSIYYINGNVGGIVGYALMNTIISNSTSKSDMINITSEETFMKNTSNESFMKDYNKSGSLMKYINSNYSFMKDTDNGYSNSFKKNTNNYNGTNSLMKNTFSNHYNKNGSLMKYSSNDYNKSGSLMKYSSNNYNKSESLMKYINSNYSFVKDTNNGHANSDNHSFMKNTSDDFVNNHSFMKDTTNDLINNYSFIKDTSNDPVNHHSFMKNTTSDIVNNYSFMKNSFDTRRSVSLMKNMLRSSSLLTTNTPIGLICGRMKRSVIKCCNDDDNTNLYGIIDKYSKVYDCEGNDITEYEEEQDDTDAEISELVSGNVYSIKTKRGLEDLANLVNKGNDASGCTIELDDDIEIDSFEPIGSLDSPFKGTFDGKSHSIKLTQTVEFDSSVSCIGLFGYVVNGTIKNLTFSPYSSSIYINVSANGSTVISGICGECNNSTIDTCNNQVPIYGGSTVIGGVCGYAFNGSTISNCTNTGEIQSSSGSNIGGVVGYINGSSTSGNNLSNSANVTGSKYVGGIVGYIMNASLSSSKNESSSTVTGSENVGLVYGYNNGGTVSQCIENGTLMINEREEDTLSEDIVEEQISEFTENMIYFVQTEDRLKNIAKLINNNGCENGCIFILGRDITINDFIQIGNSNNPFKNIFDGAGYSITVKNSTTLNGLFHTISGGGGVFYLILNPKSDVSISSTDEDSCSAFCANLNDGVIHGCINNIPVEGKGSVGGICGIMNNDKAQINNCINNVSVSGSSNYVGGIIGHFTGGSVSGCVNNGDVSGNDCVGGVCGNQEGSSTSMSACDSYAENVTGAEYVGGIVGFFSYGSITCSKIGYGTITGTSNYGNIYGYKSSSATYINCMNEEEEDIEQVSSLESGMAYGIYTSNGLKALSNLVNNGYNGDNTHTYLYHDIEISDHTPIGKDATHYYSGSFEALDTIITITKQINISTPYGGIFGYVQGKNDNDPVKIKGIVIKSNLSGYSLVGSSVTVIGAICGSINNVTITQCISYIDISGSHDDVAGITGYAYDNSKVSSCYNYGKISGQLSNCGGIVGATGKDVSITSCYNYGKITGTYEVGGIVGYTGYDNNNITSCYNYENVSGSSKVGGIVGILHNGGSVTDCINSGSVDSSGMYCGGICGECGSSAYINSSKNSGSITGNSYDVGGICGYSEHVFIDCENTASVTGEAYVGGICGQLKLTDNTAYTKSCKSSGSISGNFYVGGIYGYIESNTNPIRIRSCSNSGKLYNSKGFTFVGGIIGYINGGGDISGMILSSYNTGDISNEGSNSSSRGIGGLIGYIDNLKISVGYCYNTGNINGDAGIIGNIENGSVYLSSCYNKGNISRNLPCAGLLYSSSCSSIIVMSCYNQGEILTTGNVKSDAGLILDNSGNTCNISYSYNTGSVEKGYPIANKCSSTNVYYLSSNDYYSTDCGTSKTYDEMTSDSFLDLLGNRFEEGNEYPELLMIDEYDFILDGEYLYNESTFMDDSSYLILEVDGWNQFKSLIENGNDGSTCEFYLYGDMSVSESPFIEGSFSGTFYGENHTITITKSISSSGTIYGLFRVINEGSINDLNIYVSDSSITLNTSYDITGTLVGYMINGTINNCTSTLGVSVSSSNVWIGGLVGYAVNSVIKSSYHINGVNASSSSHVGGLVGFANGITIESSYSEGSTIGNIYIGGLIGYAQGNINVTSSYNVDGVSSSEGYVGGLIGYEESTNITITSCYNTGQVTSDNDYIGGLIGYAADSITITSSYNKANISGASYVGGLIGYAADSITITSSYNKESISGASYVGGLIGYAKGSITINSSYTASNAYEISATGNYLGGLIGYAKGSVSIDSSYNVCNVKSKNSGGSYVGGLVGYAADSISISSSYNKGSSITCKGEAAGGLIGYSSTSTTIDSSYNKGSVSVGSKNVGGLVGYAYKSTSITSSYNTGSIKVQNNGEKYVNAGGLIGNNTGDLNIKKSYNTGTVNGYKGSAVGGIIGNAYQYGGNTSLVSCYNTGNISSDSYHVGGLIGVLNDDTTITACYNRGNISSGENCAGGLFGYGIDDVSATSCYSTGDVSANKYGNKIYGASNSSAFTLSFSKVYQLKDADGSDNTDSGITTKDDSYFKSSDMITSLGSDYYESDSDSKYNDGYPILKDVTYSS